MYKQIAGALALTLASGLTFAQQPAVGIGVSHTNNNASANLGNAAGVPLPNTNSIYMPIQLANSPLWIEPFFAYGNSENTTSGSTNDTTLWQLGTGLFANVHETEQTHAYLGARASYLNAEIEQGGTSNDADGFMVSPTIGFGYMPVSNISFGAEASVSYASAESDDNSVEVDNTSTSTRLFVRYYFSQ